MPIVFAHLVAISIGAALVWVAGLAVSATYAFHGDFGTEPTIASSLGKAVLLAWAVLAVGLLWAIVSLIRTASAPP